MPHLEVQLIQARGFAQASPGRYYVKVGWPFTDQKSTARSESVNLMNGQPVWRQTFHLRVANFHRGLLVRVYVKRTVRSNICVGYGLVEHLSELVHNRSTLIWCPLQGPHGDAAVLLGLRAVDFGQCTPTPDGRAYFYRAPPAPAAAYAPASTPAFAPVLVAPPSLPRASVSVPSLPHQCVPADMPGPSNAVDEGPEEASRSVPPPRQSYTTLPHPIATAHSVPALGAAASSSSDAAPTLPSVRRSIVDEVCLYKEQIRGVRSDRRKKKLVKYGKRAAVVGGVVAIGVVGGLTGAVIF